MKGRGGGTSGRTSTRPASPNQSFNIQLIDREQPQDRCQPLVLWTMSQTGVGQNLALNVTAPTIRAQYTN